MLNCLIKSPFKIRLRDHRFINMVVKLKGLAREDHIGYKLQLNFDILVRSLVLRTNAKPLNLIFLCDKPSIPLIEKTFAEEQPPFELSNKVWSKYLSLIQLTSVPNPLYSSTRMRWCQDFPSLTLTWTSSAPE